MDSNEDVYLTSEEGKRAIAVVLAGGSESIKSFSPMPFEWAVSQGLVPGYSWIDKYGKNGDVDTGSTPEDIWQFEGLYNWGVDAGQDLYISSTDIDDQQEVELYCLTVDSLGNWNKEIFLQKVNGQIKTLVVTPSGDKPARCHRTENDADFGGDIKGTIYVYGDSTVSGGKPDDETKILSGIIEGSNQSKQLTFTIPSGFVGFLIRGEAGFTRSNGTDECDFAYVSRRKGKVFKEKKDFGCMSTGNNFYVDIRSFPDPIPEQTDLTIRVINVSSNNVSAWGTFDIMLVEKEYLPAALVAALGM